MREVNTLIPPGVIDVVHDERCSPAVSLVIHSFDHPNAGVTASYVTNIISGRVEPIKMDLNT
jgi:hypothetical protein